MMTEQDMIALALEKGALKAEGIPVEKVILSEEFRRICEGNGCGNFGKCWMCPPDCGTIEKMMGEIRSYGHAVFFQTVSPLEDSFDFEGMGAAAVNHARITLDFRKEAEKRYGKNLLVLSCGGCRLCEKCAKLTGEPCRRPEDAMASLESAGVDVYHTVKDTGMKYLNGQDTVTYFSAVFFSDIG